MPKAGVKYYVSELNKFFDTEMEAIAAYKDYNDKIAAENAKAEALKKAENDRLAEVEKAAHAVSDAYDNFNKLKKQFIKDYGYCRVSLKINNHWNDFFEDFHF